MKRLWIVPGAIVVLAILFLAPRMFFDGGGDVPPAAPAIRQMVVQKYGDCGPEECREMVLGLERSEERWFAVATYEGLYDDSVAASRLRIPLERRDGAWVLAEPVERSWRCGRPDSPPEFTTELCP